MNQQTHTMMEVRPPELARVVAVSNGFVKGEKSAISVNLAICLAQLGKKVCVFDVNKLSPARLLQSANSKLRNMDNLLNGEIGIEALIHGGPAGIKIIPHTTDIDDFSHLTVKQQENLLTAITQLQHDFDYLLIDTAAQINASTTSLLLGSGSIVITTTSDTHSLKDAFSLLKSIKQRKLQQPIKIVVNLVSSEAEAREIIARFNFSVRKYLGDQCGSMSFFIINEQILDFISQEKLITLEYPNSLPSYCLKNIALRLAEAGQAESLMFSNHLSELTPSTSLLPPRDRRKTDSELSWQAEALNSVQSEPMANIDPIMQELNKVWQKRKMLNIEDKSQQSTFELELLKLKTAIHFASHTESLKNETDYPATD
ncbi:MAG: AAA family ATPase [Gammaproteobacteria bacterium]|nr:AAA family ATPase [Gammaproteobacteria bacterium]